MSLAAFADPIEVRNASLVAGDEGLAFNADFALDLSARLEQALNSGVALHFVVEFELVRPRWYWFDEKLASERMQWRLVYHALSRQYRASRGTLYQNFFSLTEALRTIGTVRNWAVAERIRPDGAYYAMARMRLDTAQLPKPFQVSALTDREWTLASDWVRVTINSGNQERATP